MVTGPLPLVSQHLHRSFHSILHCNQWWLVALRSRPVLVLVGRRQQMGRKWISRRGAGRRKNQQLSQISPARRPRSRRVYTTVQAAPIIHLLHSVGVLGRHRSTNSWLRWEALIHGRTCWPTRNQHEQSRRLSTHTLQLRANREQSLFKDGLQTVKMDLQSALAPCCLWL